MGGGAAVLGQGPLLVLQRLSARFEDYNTTHPHSGLRMRSPREFIA